MLSENGLEFKIVGNGKPILWIHGLCENFSIWDYAIQNLSSYQHILINLPGCGNSKAWTNFSLTDIANEVEAILVQNKISNVCLMGHSMGGYIGLELLKKPSLLNAIFMVNSSAFPESDEKALKREKGIQVLLKNRDLYMSEFFKNIYSDSFKKEFPEIVQNQFEQSKSIPLDCVVSTMRSLMYRNDNEALLKESSVPKYFILGSEDSILPLAEMQKQSDFVQADLHLLQGCGHVCPIEQEAEFVRIIKPLLP